MKASCFLPINYCSGRISPFYYPLSCST